MQLQDLFAGLGGALQGASQGMDWLADQKRQQIQQQLQQRQQQTQEEELKRRAVMEAYQALEGGAEVDPTNENIKSMIGAGLSFEKDATGKIIKPMPVRDQLAGQQLENAQLEGRMTKDQWERRQQILNDPSFYSRPIGDRLQAGFGAGEKFDPTTPEEDLQYSASLAAAQARANASMFAASQPRHTDPATAELNRQKFLTSQRAAAMRNVLATLEGKYASPDKLPALVEEEFQRMMAGIDVDGLLGHNTASAPSATTPTMSPTKIGRFTVTPR